MLFATTMKSTVSFGHPGLEAADEGRRRCTEKLTALHPVFPASAPSAQNRNRDTAVYSMVNNEWRDGRRAALQKVLAADSGTSTRSLAVVREVMPEVASVSTAASIKRKDA